MADTESTSSEDAPQVAPEAPPPPPPAHDFSDLRGLQFVGTEKPEASEDYAEELEKELRARADRFVHSVDNAIVLASDGVIRWLGDPIGLLIAGDDVLKPRAVLLTDDALPAEAREPAETRLTLWVAAHMRRVLGPLEGLAASDGLPDSAREVADKLVEALGVLDRERVRAQVKALDQNARAVLRKLGVRFGAHYIFVPALLKPGPRALCSQLFALKRAAEPGAERLHALAAAGRTSFAAEGTLSADAYRIAGFRLCGERVVRIDIVERLTDLIRSAIPDQMRPGAAPASDASGFVVTQQMTSLTGCAGDAFASILRSLGFESHRVSKADHDAAMKKPEPAPAAPAASEIASEPAEDVHEAEAPELHQAHEAMAEELAPADEPAPIEESSAPASDGGEESQAEAPAVGERSAPIEESSPPASDGGDESQAEGETLVEAAAEPSEPAPEEWVEVWRPAPRQRHQHGRHHRRHGGGEGTGRIVWRAREPAAQAERERKRERGPRPPRPETKSDASLEAAPRETPARPAPSEPRQAEGGQERQGGRLQESKGPRRDDRRNDRGPKTYGDGGQRKEGRAPQIDPDSPFAKLLALKPLLERQDKRK